MIMERVMSLFSNNNVTVLKRPRFVAPYCYKNRRPRVICFEYLTHFTQVPITLVKSCSKGYLFVVVVL